MTDKDLLDILANEATRALAASESFPLTEEQAKEIEKYKQPTGAQTTEG